MEMPRAKLSITPDKVEPSLAMVMKISPGWGGGGGPPGGGGARGPARAAVGGGARGGGGFFRRGGGARGGRGRRTFLGPAGIEAPPLPPRPQGLPPKVLHRRSRG